MRTRFLPALIAVAGLALAGCGGGGGDDEAASDTGGDTVTVEDSVTLVSTDTLQWEPTSIEATLPDGELEFVIECGPAVEHNVAIEGVNDDAIIAECDAGETGSGTVALEPGEYTYYCTIAGHRSAGMVGQLTVG